MPGSVRLVRDKDVWELRVYLGRNDSGKVRHRYQTFRGTRQQAERALARLVSEVDREPVQLVTKDSHGFGDKTTINDAIAAWKQNGWQDLSPTTTRRYTSIWKTHIRDSIGKEAIVSLSPFNVERYFRDLKDKGLSEASVRQTRALLHRVCHLARKWSGGTLSNPIADTELPAWGLDDAKEVRAPSVTEVRRLIDAGFDYDLRVGVFIRVIAATGMRRGEACGLRWKDVDTDARVVAVNESVVATSGGTVVKGPKTRAGIRKVSIDGGTASYLRKLYSYQQDLSTACGVELGEDDFVFSCDKGGDTPPHPDTMSHAFSKVRATAGVPSDIHLHSLRHFQATALDSVISEAQKQSRLGWSTVQMARHYTDSVPDEDRRAAQHLGDLLEDSSRDRQSSTSAK